MVAHAKAVLAVAQGATDTAAATRAGRRSGAAVAHLVARCNRDGLEALSPRHGGGPAARSPSGERERIVAQARRTPEHEPDGTATWSRVPGAAGAAPGTRRVVPHVSTDTIGGVLSAAGGSWQRTRTWCPSGQAVRLRKRGRVHRTDPDAAAHNR